MRGGETAQVGRPEAKSVVSGFAVRKQQKNKIRPVNEAGRTEGFIPVTPCSLGKRQLEASSLVARGSRAAFSIACAWAPPGVAAITDALAPGREGVEGGHSQCYV